MMSKNVSFSANQTKFIEWLADPGKRKPPTQYQLAETMGVRPETLTRWKREPELMKAVRVRSRELLGEDLPKIYEALRLQANAGSFQHIKLALELTGEYQETNRHEIDGQLKIKVIYDDDHINITAPAPATNED